MKILDCQRCLRANIPSQTDPFRVVNSQQYQLFSAGFACQCESDRSSGTSGTKDDDASALEFNSSFHQRPQSASRVRVVPRELTLFSNDRVDCANPLSRLFHMIEKRHGSYLVRDRHTCSAKVSQCAEP